MLESIAMRTYRLFLVILLIPPSLFAWGEKGHALSNEAATFGTPNEMPLFFHQAYPQLVYLGYEPDRWRGGGKSLDSLNPPDHFLDYEYVQTLTLPRERYDYIALLYASGTLRRFGVEVDNPGFVPWKIAELCDSLIVQWKLWRASRPGPERFQIEQNIIHLAGILGHFVSDSANPHHATINYNGWVEPNPHGYPIDCEAHNRFETQFVSRAINLEDVLPRLRPPTLRSDYFGTALELIKDSNSLVETLYRIDRDKGFVPRRGTLQARNFAAGRIAYGASLLRDLWWSTYMNSAPQPARAIN